MATETTIYLAGPVAHAPGGGKEWREQVVDRYRDEVEFLNPLDEYNAPVEDITIGLKGDIRAEEVVESDKALLREADGVFVGYRDIKQIGTPMEVMWACERDMPVALWLRDGTSMHDVSPWYAYHTTARTNSLEMAIRHLERQGVVDE